MAQADSVPTVIRAPITATTSKAPTNRRFADPRCFIDEACTGRVLKGSNVTAVSYATAVFLLARFPWNILLILLLFLSRKKRSRFVGLDTMPSARCSVFCGGGGLL